MQEKQLNNFSSTLPKTRRGDIYILGRHRLMCGDSTDMEDIAALMNGECADMLLTDPPYNLKYEGKTKERLTLKNDNMKNEDFCTFLTQAFSNADAVMRSGAAFYIWYADTNGLEFRLACSNTGWKVRQGLVWVKNAFSLGWQDYQWKHEQCLYGWKSGAAHLWKNDRRQTTILNYAKPIRNAVHPTMKPVAMFDYLIRNNTERGDIVLDLFGGSGTTIIAAEKNQRIARVMELDEHYIDVIVQRYIETVGTDANVELLRDGAGYSVAKERC